LGGVTKEAQRGVSLRVGEEGDVTSFSGLENLDQGRRPGDQLTALEASERAMKSSLVLCGVREVASVEV